jgi:hypothetical protein
MKVILHVHPRTASTSLLTYLRENPPPQDRGGPNLLHHCHYLNDRRHKWFSKNGYTDIVRHVGKEPWKVITILRDPVAINLSAFWAWNARHVKHDFGFEYAETKRFFLETIDHRSPIRHLSSEVEAFWGFNIFDQPFANPYSITNRNRLLILKYEWIQSWPQAIEHFLGIPQAEFPHTNASKKHIDLNFSDAYLRGLYRSRHVEKFYSEEEVNEFTVRHGGKPFQRLTDKKFVTVLGKDQTFDGFQPVRIVEDEAELEDIHIRGKVGIFGPFGKSPDEIEP